MPGATQAGLNSVVAFFVIQAVAIYGESIVIAVYQRVTGDLGDGSWRGVVGFTDCVLWFAATLPLFWDPMIEVGVMQADYLPILWLNAPGEGIAGKYLAGALTGFVPEQWKAT